MKYNKKNSVKHNMEEKKVKITAIILSVIIAIEIIFASSKLLSMNNEKMLKAQASDVKENTEDEEAEEENRSIDYTSFEQRLSKIMK